MAKKTVGTPSYSGPSGPSQVKPSVEYSSNELGKTETVFDGKTPVTTNVDPSDTEPNSVPSEKPTQYWAATDPVLDYLHKPTGPKTSAPQEKEHYAPCINPSCKSYGHSHPHCKCYSGPGGTSLENSFFAQGGLVCSGPHHESCEHFADGGTIAENTLIHNKPAHAIAHVAIHHGLHGLLTKTGHSQSKNEHKPIEDFVDHAKRGSKTMHSTLENLFTSHHVEPDKTQREGLKNHLQLLREHPEKAIDVGGSIGDTLPGHAAHLGALTAQAMNHFEMLRPKKSKDKPLDTLSTDNKVDENLYDRHIDIANKPNSILNHVKDGSLVPSDISTLRALYPELHEQMKEKAFEAIVGAKEKGISIPYKQVQSLSLLLGQDLDSTMTPQSMQAIIKSQAGQQAQNQAKNQPSKPPKKASGTELKQIDKSNQNDATILQRRAMNRR